MIKRRLNNINLQNFILYLSLFLIILAGFGWRYLLILRNGSFIFDEAWDFVQANSFPAGDFIRGKYWDVPLHPPLHYLFLHFWSKIRIDEFFLRIPFVLAGSVSVLVFYFVAKEILHSKKLGLLAALLYANLAFSIIYSIQVRITQALLLIELVAFYFFLKAYRENKFKYWLLFALFLTIAFYQDYSAFWVFLIVNSYFIFDEVFKKEKNKAKIKNWLYANFIFFLLYLPWLPIFFKNLEGVPRWIDAYLVRPNLGSIANLLVSQMFGHEWRFHQLRETLMINEIWLYLLVLFPFLAASLFLGLKLLFRNIMVEDKRTILLLFCFFAPLILSFLISQFSPIFQDRNLAIFSLYPILAVCLSLKLSRKTLSRIFFIFILILFSGYNFYNINYFFKSPIGENWRIAALYLEGNLKPNEVIVAQDGYERPMLYYLNYRHQFDLKEKNIDYFVFRGKAKERIMTNLKEGKYWLFVTEWEERQRGNFWEQFLDEVQKYGVSKETFHLLRKENMGGIIIYEALYRREI